MQTQTKIIQKAGFVDWLMYLFLFICIFASNKWYSDPDLASIEIFRFEKIELFGQINIFSIFTVIFLVFIFFTKFGPHSRGNAIGSRNYLKTIFWLYLIPVDILVYLAIYLMQITLNDLGIKPIVIFFTYLVVVYFVQDVFLRKKTLPQLMRVITVLQVLFLGRCFYSIIKYHLGVGTFLPWLGKIRMGQENDFADYFILLFIIALVRVLFEKDEEKNIIRLNVVSLIATSYLIIFSLRRYLWIEFVLTLGVLFFVYSLHYRVKASRAIVPACSLIFILCSVYLLVGPERLTHNYYLGRFLTAFSLVDSSFESEYGWDTHHPEHLKEGWDNVKANWLLGVSPFGGRQLKRVATSVHTDTFFHNGYLEMWISYGLLGIILYVFFYLKSLQLGLAMFIKHENLSGLILATFLFCQLTKNIVWDTAISEMNVTVIYIVLISIVIRARYLLKA